MVCKLFHTSKLQSSSNMPLCDLILERKSRRTSLYPKRSGRFCPLPTHRFFLQPQHPRHRISYPNSGKISLRSTALPWNSILASSLLFCRRPLGPESSAPHPHTTFYLLHRTIEALGTVGQWRYRSATFLWGSFKAPVSKANNLFWRA